MDYRARTIHDQSDTDLIYDGDVDENVNLYHEAIFGSSPSHDSLLLDYVSHQEMLVSVQTAQLLTITTASTDPADSGDHPPDRTTNRPDVVSERHLSSHRALQEYQRMYMERVQDRDAAHVAPDRSTALSTHTSDAVADTRVLPGETLSAFPQGILDLEHRNDPRLTVDRPTVPSTNRSDAIYGRHLSSSRALAEYQRSLIEDVEHRNDVLLTLSRPRYAGIHSTINLFHGRPFLPGPPPPWLPRSESTDLSITLTLSAWSSGYLDLGASTINLNRGTLSAWVSQDDTYATDIPLGQDHQGLIWSALDTTRDLARKARHSWYSHTCTSHRAQALSNETFFNLGEPDSASLYHFKSTHIDHHPKSSHWQLRNLLAAPSRADIFYATGNRIQRTSLLNPETTQNVLDLSFIPPSIHHLGRRPRITTIASTSPSVFPTYHSSSVLIAGCNHSEYAILPLSTTSAVPIISTLSPSLDDDNSINHISLTATRSSTSPLAIYSSNAKGIYTLPLTLSSPSSPITKLPYPFAINATATSPDLRLRAIVGDSPTTLLTDASTGTVLTELSAHEPDAHIFAVAFSACGTYLATGAEDKIVIVWETRNFSSPVLKARCTMGCPRSLHFTTLEAGGVGLVVAEGEDWVHVLDLSSLSSSGDGCGKQSFDLFGSIAGVAVMDEGPEVVVGIADEAVGGLVVYGRGGAASSSGWRTRYGTVQDENEDLDDDLDDSPRVKRRRTRWDSSSYSRSSSYVGGYEKGEREWDGGLEDLWV